MVFNRDPTLPIHKLIKPVEPYNGEKDIAKRIKQLCIILFTAAKMQAKKHRDQKKSTNHRPSKHPLQVGDLVLVRNHNKAKLELKWEPGYRIIKLPTDWTAVTENQLTGNSSHCNVTDLKLKLPEEDWLLKAEDVGRAAKCVNHPDNLPDIGLLPDEKDTELNDKHKGYNIRQEIKSPTKLDL